MQEKTKNTIKKYIAFFYVYAFLGWIVDVTIVFISDGVLVNRGFIYEPICPMYGYAALVLILIYEKIKQKGIIRFIKKDSACYNMVFCIGVFNGMAVRYIFPSKVVGLFKWTI